MLHAWLGAGRLACQGLGQTATVEAIDSVEDGLQRLAAVISSGDRLAPVRLWLGGDVCRLACAPSISGVKDHEDAQAAVQAHLAAVGGVVPLGWTAVLAESQPGRAAWRVAVVPASLVDDTRRVLGRRAISMRPWWSWALRRCRQSPEAQTGCTYDGAALTICRWNSDGGVEEADTVVPIEDPASVRRLLLRRGLVGTQAPPPRLAWFDGPGQSVDHMADASIEGQGMGRGADDDFPWSGDVRWDDGV